MTRTARCVLLLTLLLCSPCLAIELSQDFDSGSLDVAQSTVSGTTVNLVGRRTWTLSGYASTYRWVYFKASGVEGLAPTFNISLRAAFWAASAVTATFTATTRAIGTSSTAGS